MSIELQFQPILEQWPMLLAGAGLTIVLTVVATLIGMIVAIGCAW
ncbi:MAG: hypothetical protein H6R19_3463, partial [Proteobacteria bacterium]|nr:hypothetical protein [Pseudomonadota bacterium]MBS1211065.1 hypothetical protein [Pseudomonadota bacterium]